MKRFVFLLAFCLVALFGSFLHAQQPQIKVLVNGSEVSGNVVLDGTKRLCFMVSDGKPADMGYAYEFGALQLIPPTGAPVELRATLVENRCLTIYSLRTSWLQTYAQGFKVRLSGITRHNPDHSTDILPFTPQQLELSFSAH